MGKPLEEYNRKRKFEATPEPSGAKKSKPKRKRSAAAHALRFCIQKHDASHLHYDFRLELEGALKSWAVPKGPSLDPKVRRLAVHVEEHPIDYATFEGSIPEGHYGAGEVIVWDRGIWHPREDPVEAYKKGKLKFELEGEKLSGVWNLVRTNMAGKKEQWFLIKSKDEAARPEEEYDILEDQPDSVLSDRTLVPKKPAAKTARPKPVKKPSAPKRPVKKGTLTGAQKAAIPESLKPELAILVDAAPSGDWRYEIKFDGYRIMARINDGEVRLFSRNGHDWTAKMPRQAEALANLGLESAWVDGEVIVADKDGRPDFQALQNAFEKEQSGSIVYYLFDLPYLNGMDLREVALEERRAALSTVLERHEDAVLCFSEDFDDSPESMLKSACQMKLEGLIGKRAGSTYVSRRSTDWIKLKCKNRQEFVLVGYTEPKGKRSAFGALLLGLHDPDSGELRYAGKVGTGFNEATLQTIHARLKRLEIKRASVSNPPTGFDAKGVHWLKPELLAEVAYAEMTRERIVRHSVFHGLRDDKPAKQISEEKPSPAKKVAKPTAKAKKTTKASEQITITHPDRIIDHTSGTTKMRLAEFYAQTAEWILPQLANRPVALVRAPEGISGERFFQKHAEHLSIPGITIQGKEYSGQPVMIIDNQQALIGALQMNTIELHTWNATTRDLERPDRFILDLDPDPALPWKRMVEATRMTLGVLDELGLVSFLKTSGGRGIHIVVPLEPKDSWDRVKDFSHAIVKHIAKRMPERFSAVSGPKNRVGRIFIDYLRNGQGATTIAAYAVRAREGLPVSVPIYREEVAEIKGANAWNIKNLHARLADLAEDPWAKYSSSKQTISARMRKRIGPKKASGQSRGEFCHG
ncbi:MAG: DNA ligase D [Gammaproteobacteria bacterium]